jgi:hypothetical protein
VAFRRLTPDEFEAKARPVLDRLIRTFDVYEGPFQNQVEGRLILYTLGFWLDEDQFRAVCESAQAAGDHQLLYTDFRGYLSGPELMPHYTWELSLFEYDEYCDADDGPVNKDHDIGIPLDRILYSPAGQWAVVLPDIFAVIGGSAQFIEQFKTSYPGWREHIGLFVDTFLEGARERKADVAWVPKLLQHVYGDDAPEFVP